MMFRVRLKTDLSNRYVVDRFDGEAVVFPRFSYNVIIAKRSPRDGIRENRLALTRTAAPRQKLHSVDPNARPADGASF